MKSAAGFFCSLFLLAVLGAPGLRAADPVVSNVSFAQRPGTKLVDISYDLEADGAANVSVAISADGGATWAVPATSLTGDAGVGVVAGVGKAIVWDMGADWDGQHTDQLVVRVTATTAAAPVETYLVIDLSAGPEAASYPVSYLDAVPAGGWTDEHKTTKLVLRRIPAGTFTMGSPAGELGRNTGEAQHQVTLTKDFYIGVFEVTQKQYERVMGTWPSYFNNTTYRDARPVEQVSWNDIRGGTWPGTPAGSGQPAAGTFVQRLRDRTGLEL
ncbi:MAG: SUMF1/EgtB/PvdO family nonheme iron enzyme, partial [Lentisphaeria bacterium]|nr:SUMF1/EgtB/PvdO family nonheme iron enzyme [Lentisphaeria bacterium]